MALYGSYPMSREEGPSMTSPHAHRRTALQWASREDDWGPQEVDARKLGNEEVLSCRDLYAIPKNCPGCQQQTSCQSCLFGSESTDFRQIYDGMSHSWCAIDSDSEKRTANEKTSGNKRSLRRVLGRMDERSVSYSSQAE
jgi:hypothetical protein